MKSQIEVIIANRSMPLEYGSDEMPKRIHIVPRGELTNAEAGVVQVLDEKAINSIYDDLVANKATKGGLYMGEEHFIYDSSRSSEAFAWATKFEKDDQGIWAINPDYTDVGAPAIKNKRFKWTSFVADPKYKHVEKLGNGRVRILKIDTVGFTNFANGKELLTPISNRKFPGSRESVDGNEQTKNERTQTMKSIATQLKLSAEASEEAILAEVIRIQNRNAALEPLEATNTTLKNRCTELEAEQCDVLLDVHGVTDVKARETLKPMLAPLKNRADRATALINLGHKPVDPKARKQSVILNRGDAKGGTDGSDEGTVTEEQGERIKNRADELKHANPQRRYEACFAQAEQEVLAKK
jgi:hypothetical protein